MCFLIFYFVPILLNLGEYSDEKVYKNMHINLGITSVQRNSTNRSVYVCLGEIYTYILIQVAQLKSQLKFAYFSQKLFSLELVPPFHSAGLLAC